MIGRTVSHFKILRELGRGGMGVVYVARDLDLHRDVALKFLPAHSTGDESAVARFIQEARAASALDHENICTVHEVGRAEDGTTFIAMALYEGRTLRELIDEGPLDVDRALDVAIQIAEGLAAAHANTIVHRDVKPANFVITMRGHVKILDFGLAKLTAVSAGLTASGMTPGTAGYMSPEQVRGESVDARTDVWGLGVVLYEMLCARLPFAGEHAAALAYSILNEAPKPLADRRADVPVPVAHAIERALSKDAGVRYATAGQMGAALRACRDKAAPARRRRPSRPVLFTALAALVVAVAALALWQRGRNAKITWAREEALPEIEQLVSERSPTSGQPGHWRAYELAAEVEAILPREPLLERLRPAIARDVQFLSTPPGARVRARPYGDAGAQWRDMGVTPLRVAFPLGISRLEFERDGYAPVTDIVMNHVIFGDTVIVAMHRQDEMVAGMVWMTEGEKRLALPGLEGIEEEFVPGFWVDRTEVSNREYKRFVEAGGYRRSELWKPPFVENGRTLAFEEAMARFVDATGRPGPATWEAGDYPRGMEDHPVSGVSWYEAAAFAEFAGKRLPTIYHWSAVAATWAASAIAPVANFQGKGPEPVDGTAVLHRSGAVNLAGNVREWCWNESDEGQRFILGGGWNDPPYAFTDAYAQRMFDRSITNGFRCIQSAGGAEPDARLGRGIERPFRDFFAEKSVDDRVFAFLLQQYAYDRTDLSPHVEYERDDGDWIRQKVTFNAAYGNERVIAHLFLPKGRKPPYQTVIIFPGAGDLFQRSSERIRTEHVDFHVRSGRAVMYPVYKGMFERGGVVSTSQPQESVAYRDWTIAMARDLSRSIDYLETRDDIDAERLTYYGVSLGGSLGPIMLAVEKRFKAAVLYVAGLKFQRALPEVDGLNFVPRATTPVLMVGARHDFFFPLETSQRPLFELLGTPAGHKKWVVYDGGHTVPRNKLIAETLAWLDRYLGPVAAD